MLNKNVCIPVMNKAVTIENLCEFLVIMLSASRLIQKQQLTLCGIPAYYGYMWADVLGNSPLLNVTNLYCVLLIFKKPFFSFSNSSTIFSFFMA